MSKNPSHTKNFSANGRWRAPRAVLLLASAIGASIAGTVILILGTLVSRIQRLLFLQNQPRSLNQTEEELLRGVFDDSLALDNIRIIEGRSGLFGVNSRPFTLGNTIYMKAYTAPEILVHECVHVWQYQHFGPRYAAEALGAQLLLGDSAYNWKAELARGKSEWSEFNKEAQAQMIQEIWMQRNSSAAHQHDELAAATLKSLRTRKNTRPSRSL